MTPKVFPFDELPGLVGQALGTSDWILVDQARIDAFAHVTGDHQWIHVDAGRAAEGPFGSTVAHGYLTLSLLPAMVANAFEINGSRMGVNLWHQSLALPPPRYRSAAACVAISGCSPVTPSKVASSSSSRQRSNVKDLQNPCA